MKSRSSRLKSATVCGFRGTTLGASPCPGRRRSLGACAGAVGANGNGGGWRGNGVKCLHAHVGDALVRGRAANAIGHVVLEKLARDGVETDGNSECWRACAQPRSRA